MEITQTYQATLLALGVLAVIMLCQVVVSDLVGIKLKHVPGAQIPTDHDSFLFRVSRTVANTNESVSIFVIAVFFCIFSNASPTFTANAAWGFVIARFLYALFYYSNLKILRSVSFAFSLLAVLALLVIGFKA